MYHFKETFRKRNHCLSGKKNNNVLKYESNVEKTPDLYKNFLDIIILDEPPHNFLKGQY